MYRKKKPCAQSLSSFEDNVLANKPNYDSIWCKSKYYIIIIE